MKNTKKYLTLLASAFMVGCIASCGGISNDSSTEDSLTSETSSAPEVGDANWVDYASAAKLKANYTGKEFLKDGIGEVTLVSKVDGDTAHFKQVSGDTGTIKGRYNCIDTPESTGMLEPWGHGASEFNGEMLKNAKHIVLTTDSTDQKEGEKPVTDSTGGRYLIYVWVTTEELPALDDYVCVNLALCQYGWSKAKGASGKDYADQFIGASSQAQKYKLHLWSEDIDPDFNYADPVKITLRHVVDGIGSDGNKYDWVGSKVTFEATVAACGPDQGAAYVVDDIEVSGSTKRYGMYVFTQYIQYTPLLTAGNRIELTGTVSEYNGVLQLVDVSYSDYYKEDGDMKILETGLDVQPLTLADGESAKKFASDEYLNTVVKVDLVCTGGYATQNTATKTAYSFTLYCRDKNNPSDELNIRIVDSISVKYPGTLTRVQDNVDFFAGKKSIAESTGKGSDNRKVEYITITGGLVKYTTSTGKTSYQVNLCKINGLELHMSQN